MPPSQRPLPLPVGRRSRRLHRRRALSPDAAAACRPTPSPPTPPPRPTPSSPPIIRPDKAATIAAFRRPTPAPSLGRRSLPSLFILFLRACARYVSRRSALCFPPFRANYAALPQSRSLCTERPLLYGNCGPPFRAASLAPIGLLYKAPPLLERSPVAPNAETSQVVVAHQFGQIHAVFNPVDSS